MIYIKQPCFLQGCSGKPLCFARLAALPGFMLGRVADCCEYSWFSTESLLALCQSVSSGRGLRKGFPKPTRLMPSESNGIRLFLVPHVFYRDFRVNRLYIIKQEKKGEQCGKRYFTRDGRCASKR